MLNSCFLYLGVYSTLFFATPIIAHNICALISIDGYCLVDVCDIEQLKMKPSFVQTYSGKVGEFPHSAVTDISGERCHTDIQIQIQRVWIDCGFSSSWRSSGKWLHVFRCVESSVCSFYITFAATEAFDDDGLPHTLEHLVFMGSEKYPFKVTDIQVVVYTLALSSGCFGLVG